MTFLSLVSRTALLAVFALALVSKLAGLARYRLFVNAIAGLTDAPRWAHRIAPAVLALELAACVLLASGIRAGTLLALTLLAAFTVGIATALQRQRRVPCRCFSGSDEPVGRAHLIRNLLLMAIAAVAAIAPSPPNTSMTERAVYVAIGAALGLLATQWNRLVFVFGLTEPSSERGR
jgi:hypothetical protein